MLTYVFVLVFVIIFADFFIRYQTPVDSFKPLFSKEELFTLVISTAVILLTIFAILQCLKVYYG